MKRALLIGSIVMATAAYGQGMPGKDFQNGQIRSEQSNDGFDRDGRGGRDDGRGGRDGRDDGRGGRDDGRGGRDDGRGGRDDGRGGNDDGRDGHGRPPMPPHPPRPPMPANCGNYMMQQMCTGNDIAIWTNPYVSRQTTGYDCMALCNRKLYEMGWNGYACCQLQQHPDHGANCRLRDGMPVRGGAYVGASSCEPSRRY